MKKLITTLLSGAMAVMSAGAAQHWVGGDISLLPEYEKAGAQYKDHDGKPIAELLPWLHDQGMNAMRVRLFVNPSKYKEQHQNDANADTRYDPNACQDLDYIIPLCKRIVDNGMVLMLDFHYSDTWADPAKQWTPIDWQGLGDEELYQKIFDYTRDVLLQLKAAGVTPTFIQPGNEISYGMLWGPVGTSTPKKALMGSAANWERFATLLKMAIVACNDVCPDAKIILHTERVQQPDVLENFYNQMAKYNVPYEIIGLSYYPYFHGNLSVLDKALKTLTQKFSDKNIMIVETGYSYKWEYNAFGTSLSGWYNAPLFDSTTGKATEALKELCSFGTSAVEEIEADNGAATDRWYNLQGIRVDKPKTSGIYIRNGRKTYVRVQ